MPTNRRYRLKARRPALTEGEKLELTHGFLLDGMKGFVSESEKKAAWKAFREVLIPEYCQENPGSMPHGWWRYDAPVEAAHDDTTRGFYAFRRNNESEHGCILRLGVLDLAKALGYQEPEPLSENVIDFDIHKAFR